MKLLFSILSFIFLLYSCASRKEYIYLQGESILNQKTINYSVKFKNDDLLSITVLGADENNSNLFNLNISNNASNKNDGSKIGYLIDENGEIDFPIIGKVKIADLNRNEAIQLLKSKIGLYINNPIININILNFKITVIGEVKNPGTFTIPNDRLTILEAIGLAGDLNITGKRKDIKVIREEKGLTSEYLIDLTSKELLNSPVYYLKQNDVIYVSPNKTKVNSSAYNPSITIFVSLATLLITTINILSK